MHYKNLTIIGTSHIAHESKEEVKRAFEEIKPDIIALELDRKRLYALMHPQQRKLRWHNIKKVGLQGFLFALLGSFAERKLGQHVGTLPGAEMKAAITLAKKNKIPIEFIDQDIEVTLQKISQNLTGKEKWHFFADIFKALILRKKEVDFDLRKVPDKKVIGKLMEKVRERYPNIYHVLVEERNGFMAEKLRKLMAEHEDKKILAVVGAGHEEEIIELLKKPSIRYSFSIG